MELAQPARARSYYGHQAEISTIVTTRIRKNPRVLFLGMGNQLSNYALQKMISADIDICMVVLPQFEMGFGERREKTITLHRPGRTGSLKIVNPFIVPAIVELAWSNRIKAVAISDPSDSDVQDVILEQQPDVACVACFPWLIPPRLLNAVPLGFLNLHPSLLPSYRGPHPLFWIFRNGDFGNFGVTIHIMDERFDQGNIISQAPITLPGGISGPQAEAWCGRIGGQLLVEAIDALDYTRPIGRPQPKGGQYFKAPTKKDFSISISWSAERAYNFIRGTNHWNQPYELRVKNNDFLLKDAISFTVDGQLARSFVVSGRTVEVQMNPGTLKSAMLQED